MKFNSFIESLREKSESQFTDNKLSTDVISIDQISHPLIMIEGSYFINMLK